MITNIVGSLLLIWTVFSWAKSIRGIVKAKVPFTPTDKFLNYPLLFAWLTFATIFSIGMIVNN